MSTTTSTVNFSTPKKQNPNPHPYAIKTTSTALLSRNSSSSSTPSTNHHYIPPSSPSPSPTQTGFGKYGGGGGEKRYTRHRYSRSLTSDLPLPLPTPRSAVEGSFGNDDDEDDDTPRRRVQRAYSLPQEIELPQDPKRWTPSEVSMYLTASLNTGGHDLPIPVARDIAAFVRDKKITGKSFLRLKEVDLEAYGINQLWRTTLVNASRALKKNVSHGRSNHIEHDDNGDNNLSLSSNSNVAINNRQRSLSTTSETRGRVRDMIDTLERSSSASSSESEQERSSSDGNMDTGYKQDKAYHNRHRSLEQQQGRLPQRGSVSNLFGASGPDPDRPSEREIEDKDNTITAHARRNVNGNEPRLLPFPPTGASNPGHHSYGYSHIVTPSHTGASFPLPASPDHVQSQQTSSYYIDSNHAQPSQHHPPYLFPSHSQPNHNPNTFDYYELGFKNALSISSPNPQGPPIRSPNSQRYVVQHNHPHVNPQSSPTSGSSSKSGSTGRPLPYPPIVGEAELFHPRPRMGLGVGGLAGLASGLEDGLDVEEGGRDENTASESQSRGGGNEEAVARPETTKSGNEHEAGFDFETEATAKKVGDGVEGLEEEPSIQELLAQPKTQVQTISGVEAWEMELGETVKRISSNTNAAGSGGGGEDNTSLTMSVGGGSKVRTRPKKREMIMGEIGRKSGRAGASVGLEGGRKRITGVLDPGLFEAPEQVGDGDGGSIDRNGSEVTSTQVSEASTSTSILRESALVERESLIAERESTIAGRESSLDIRETSIAERGSNVTGREFIVAERESSLDLRESSVSESESTIAARESAISADKSEIQQRITEVQKRELDMDKRELEVQKREREVSNRENKVERREEEVKEWYEGKLAEIERALEVPTNDPLIIASTSKTTAKPSKWPTSPIQYARRLYATFLLPVLGEERTPRFLLRDNGSSRVEEYECVSPSTTTPTAATSTTPPPRLISSWSIKRDFFLNRVLAGTGRGSYFVLISIGMCMVFLRGVVRRILEVGWRKR